MCKRVGIQFYVGYINIYIDTYMYIGIYIYIYIVYACNVSECAKLVMCVTKNLVGASQ